MPCCWECCHPYIHDNQGQSINTSVSWLQWCPSWTRPVDTTCSDYCRWFLTFTPWWVRRDGWVSEIMKVVFRDEFWSRCVILSNRNNHLKVTKGVRGGHTNECRVSYLAFILKQTAAAQGQTLKNSLTPLPIPLQPPNGWGNIRKRVITRWPPTNLSEDKFYRKRKGETTLLAKTEQVICSFTFNIWQIADVRSQK